jgi:uncharacterized protein (DUF302 family)/glutaredoxin
MNSTSNITLYQREECPFCQLVRKQLTLLGLNAALIQVEENGADRQQLIEVSGQKAVPVLVDDDEILTDSARILTYLQEKYGSGQAQPLPANTYHIKTQLNLPLDKAVQLTRDALLLEGFEILDETKRSENILRSLQKGRATDQVAISICHPEVAPELLSKEPELGLILPCKVVIRSENADHATVTTVNPVKLLTVVARDDLIPLAMKLKKHMDKAIQGLAALD